MAIGHFDKELFLSSGKYNLRVNEQIRIREVFLIDQEGEKIGEIDTDKAKEMAADAGLDLVEIVPTAKPPVCKIIDFGKYKFELEKKAKEAKKNQHIVKLKEIRLQPKIDTHDYNFKLNHIIEFLNKGNKVKITIRFRGRQMAHTYIGEDVLKKFAEDLKDLAVIEKQPSQEGRTLSMIVAPLKKK
jgi:translation initiation factor IF-3